MTYAKKRNIIIVGIIFLLGILAGGYIKKGDEIIQYFQSDAQLYLVESVIDGDTFKIQDGPAQNPADNEAGRQRVRFINIDAPEKGECYYQESKQALTDLIQGKQVKLIKDISEKDDYGRLLRYVILPSETDGDDILVEQYLAENGYVEYVPSPSNNRYRDLISSAQWQAYDNQIGMWGACGYQPKNINKRQQDSSPPDENCIIKGNVSEKGFGKTYLVPGCDNYESVKVDTRKGEQYFCTEAEAVEAGFRKATNCP